MAMTGIQQFAWDHPWTDESVDRSPPTYLVPVKNGGSFKIGLSINL